MQHHPRAVFCDTVKQGPVIRTGDPWWQCLFRALAFALSLPSRETAGVPWYVRNGGCGSWWEPPALASAVPR